MRIIHRIYEYARGLSGEAVRYVIIGGLTTLVDLAVFALTTDIFHIDITFGNIISISAAILFAYVTNKLIVFKNRCETRLGLALEFIKFVGARLFTMALQVGLLALFVDVFGQHKYVGKAESIVIVVITNYVISKLIVFRKKQADQ